jgi:spectinomycin phosphotransferase
VLAEPDDLDRDELLAALEAGWNLRAAVLDYLPVGFGSHHWLADGADGTRHFVSVDDLEAGFQAGPDADGTFGALARAFGTAAALKEDAGLEFVVAPIRDRDDAVIRRLAPRYALRVMPFVAGTSTLFGRYESAEERRRMGTVLGRLHSATERLPAGLPRREDFALPSRGELDRALQDIDRPWTAGPFAEPTRELLRRSGEDLRRRLDEHDATAARIAGSSQDWVVTHGEAHRANVMLGREGSIHFVDWDTVLVAPRERDLQMILDEELNGWDEYRAVVGHVPLDEDALGLYRRAWALRDIATYVAEFRRPHRRTENTLKAWHGLRGELE